MASILPHSGARTVSQVVYDTLLEEAMPSIAASVAIFANAPAGTKQIWLTIRGQGITITTDGTTAATASAHGQDFAVTTAFTPEVFDKTQAQALKFRAIQQSATATGWITYLG